MSSRVKDLIKPLQYHLSNLKNGKRGILWQIMIPKMGSKLLIKVVVPVTVKNVERSYSESLYINSFLPFFKLSFAELCP